MMPIKKLPVGFKDDILDISVNEERRYNIIDNADGTKTLEDATRYLQIGSLFGAKEINETNAAVNQLIDEAITGEKDFILINQETLNFIDKSCILYDNRITEDSLADVYFTSTSVDSAERAVITVDTHNGDVTLTSARIPEGVIRATIHIRVV